MLTSDTNHHGSFNHNNSNNGCSTAAASSSSYVWSDVSVIRDILRGTTLSELRDLELYAFLRDSAVWLADPRCPGEVRWQVMTVLRTVPWNRYLIVRPPAPHAAAAASSSTATGGKAERGAPRAHVPSSSTLATAAAAPSAVSAAVIQRQFEKITSAFERLCMVLLQQSSKMVEGVLEGALKPFTMLIGPTALAGGLTMLLPTAMMWRVLHAALVLHPNHVTEQSLLRWLEPLVPKRRWAHVEQHVAFVRWVLHLALDATLPPPSVLSLDGAPTHVEEGSSRPQEDSGTDTRHHHHKKRHHHSVSIASSETDTGALSDFGHVGLSHNNNNIGGGITGATTSSSTMASNKLLAYRDALIGLLLRYLMDMELSISTVSSTASSSYCSSSSSSSLSSMFLPLKSGGGGTASYCGSMETASHNMGSGGDEHPTSSSASLSEDDRRVLSTLRHCVGVLYQRLEEDQRVQQEAGACGNMHWWDRVLLPFHLGSVLASPSPPLVMHLIAPAIALAGTNGESVDLAHKVVSVVVKSGGGKSGAHHHHHSSPSSSLGSEVRQRAATHIGPLLQLLPHEAMEPNRRRLMKWLANTAAVLATPPGTPRGAGGGLHPAAGSHHHHHSGPFAAAHTGRLSQTVFAQCMLLANALRTTVDASLDLPTTVYEALVSSLRPDAAAPTDSGSELLVAQRQGLLMPSLYDEVELLRHPSLWQARLAEEEAKRQKQTRREGRLTSTRSSKGTVVDTAAADANGSRKRGRSEDW